MIRQYFTSILEIARLEFQRNFRISTRKSWSIIYTLFIQVSFVLIIIASLRLSNFLTKEEHIRLLISIFLTFQVYSLPGFVIMITYDNFIQDPVLDLFAVASTHRSKFLFGKLFSTLAYIYLIFFFNNLIGFIVLMIIFPQSVIMLFYLRSILSFVVILLFFITTTVYLILIVRKMGTDLVSTIFLPLTFYYILPFLLVNSLSYQVFNPIITNFVPTIWVLNFIEYTVFYKVIDIEILVLPVIISISSIFSTRMYSQFEFN